MTANAGSVCLDVSQSGSRRQESSQESCFVLLQAAADLGKRILIGRGNALNIAGRRQIQFSFSD